MPRYTRPVVGTAFVAALLVASGSPPAMARSAARSTEPRVRVSTSTIVVRNGTTVDLKIRYSCASGHQPALYADIWQGGTLQQPVSLYNSEQPGAVLPALTCDGKTYSATLTLLRVLLPPYVSLGTTSGGYGRAHATVVLYDLTTAHRDMSVEDVTVRS
jgi:hypothetical protein